MLERKRDTSITLVKMSWPFAVGVLPSVLVGHGSSLVSERSRLRFSYNTGKDSASQLIVTAIQKSSSMDVQDARRRTVSRLRTARGVAVEEAASFRVLKPGEKNFPEIATAQRVLFKWDTKLCACQY